MNTWKIILPAGGELDSTGLVKYELRIVVSQLAT